MTTLSLRRNAPFDLAPFAALVDDAGDLARVNPNAKFPVDPLEWQEKWLGEPDDVSFYILNDAGREVGFFALRVGVGPEVRHLTYVYLAPSLRGGAGAEVTALVERAARELRALSVMLKCDLDNAPALNAYAAAGYEELGRRDGVATLRWDLDRG